MLLILGIIEFFTIHHASKFIDKYPNGWRQICLYAIGVLFTFPLYILHLKNGESPKNAYLLAFLSSGVGTAFGWMSDNVK